MAGSDTEAAFGFELARAVIGIVVRPFSAVGASKDSSAGGPSGEFAWRERELAALSEEYFS
jgi:hypothetical protein